MLDRRVDEVSKLGEVDNAVHLAPHIGVGLPEQRAVQVDILTPGQVGVKPGAEFEQGRNPAIDRDAPGGRFENARDELERGALARAVVSNQADGFATVHSEAHLAQRPERAAVEMLAAPQQVGNALVDGNLPVVLKRKLLAHPVELDDWL